MGLENQIIAEMATKRIVISSVSSEKNSPQIKNVVNLLKFLIQETRAENDNATLRRVFRNQGKIEGFNQLIDIMTKDFPMQEDDRR